MRNPGTLELPGCEILAPHNYRAQPGISARHPGPHLGLDPRLRLNLRYCAANRPAPAVQNDRTQESASSAAWSVRAMGDYRLLEPVFGKSEALKALVTFTGSIMRWSRTQSLNFWSWGPAL